MLSDQACLITRGSEGIGRATAQAIARQGGASLAAPRMYVWCLSFVIDGVPSLAESAGSAIVVSSAASGQRGKPGVVAYAGSKWGTIDLRLFAALELAAKGIRLRVIAPAYIATDTWLEMLGVQAEMLAAKRTLFRLGHPEDVADASRHVSGAVIPVDGGLSA